MVSASLVKPGTKHSPRSIVIFDNFSRGTMANVARAAQDPRVRIVEGDIRDRDAVLVERDSNEIRAVFRPVSPPRVLIVTEMYRRDWTATAGSDPLPVIEVYGGFIGVPLRPGVTSVTLRYRPRGIVAATILGYGAVAIALGVLAMTHARLRALYSC